MKGLGGRHRLHSSVDCDDIDAASACMSLGDNVCIAISGGEADEVMVRSECTPNSF